MCGIKTIYPHAPDRTGKLVKNMAATILYVNLAMGSPEDFDEWKFARHSYCDDDLGAPQTVSQSSVLNNVK